MKDKELKSEEIEACLKLGGAGEGRVVQGRGKWRGRRWYSVARNT